MPPTDNAKTPEGAVRQRLLQAATELFAQKGYAATTVREIVAAAGVTKPVLYYYFGNKEGLYLELMGSVTQSFQSILQEHPQPGATARQRILRLGELAFQVFCSHLQVMKIMHAIYYGPPQGAPFVDFDALHQQFQDELLKLVQEGMDNGEFRAGDAQVMAWSLLGAEHLAMELELCMPGQRMGLEGLLRATGLILDGIAASKPIGG